MIGNDASSKVVKPDKCVLAFGIPMSEEAFLRDLMHPNKEFAKRFSGAWERYFNQITSSFRKFTPILRHLGVEICTDLTLDGFGDLCSRGRFEVVILFSHWKKDAIEFYDGFADVSQIVDKVPESFSGILDLCVCHPIKLVESLRAIRPNCLIEFLGNKSATPRYWLFFYMALFKHLAHCDLSYGVAVSQVIKELEKIVKGTAGSEISKSCD